jgi:hypothetical protein
MSSQVPVWFWRRMSRLVADQESRGGDGDSGAGERDSVMGMNLAEGCWAVNAVPWRAEREARDGWFLLFIWFVWFVWLN